MSFIHDDSGKKHARSSTNSRSSLKSINSTSSEIFLDENIPAALPVIDSYDKNNLLNSQKYKDAMQVFEAQSGRLSNYLKIGSKGTFLTHSNLISSIPPEEIETIIDAYIGVLAAVNDDKEMQYIFERAKEGLKIAMRFDAKTRKTMGEDTVDKILHIFEEDLVKPNEKGYKLVMNICN